MELIRSGKEDIIKRIGPISISIGLISSLLVIISLFVFSDLFYAWEAKTLDYRFKLRGNINTDPGIVLIDCDDRSISKIGRWPWDRSWHAQMIEILSESEAGAIAYDILFGQPVDKRSDEALILATQKGKKVYYPVGFELSNEDGRKDNDGETEAIKVFGYQGRPIEKAVYLKVRRSLAPFPSLSNVSKGIGHISANRDRDGIIRRVPLVVDLDGIPFPAFGLQAAAGYLDVAQDSISIYPGKEIILKNAHISEGRRQDIRIPIDQQGMMLINYAGRWVDTYDHYSFIDILEKAQTADGMAELKNRLKGKLILISNSATGFDVKSVPIEVDYPGGGIHANIINTIITNNFLKDISPGIKIPLLLLIGIVSALLCHIKKWEKKVVFILLFSGVYLYLGYLLFKYMGIVIDLFSPTLVIIASTLAVSLYQLNLEKEMVARLSGEKKMVTDEMTMIKGRLGQKEMELGLINQELSSLKTEMDKTSSGLIEQMTKVGELEERLEEESREKERLLKIKKELDDKVAHIFVHSTKQDFSLKGRWEERRSECARYGIVTRNERMLKIFEEVKKAAKTDYPILILGESGTGKGLLAKAVHTMSPRGDKPFVVVDLPAIAENLIESEIFGHVKGSFTGALSNKIGRFELANEGTIFLDEIGDMDLSLQVKLRRVLQDKVIERVGDARPVRIDARIISATNKDLRAEIRGGRFREDLFHRLNVISIELLPLRERREDIEILVHYFIDKAGIEYKKEIRGISEAAMKALMEDGWSGNIRELENRISRAAVMAEGDIITEDDIGSDKQEGDRGLTEDRDAPDRRINVEGDSVFLVLMRKNLFEIGKTAERLRLSRGTVGSRFKGICLQCLLKHNGDIGSTAREIAGDHKLAEIASDRIREYYENIIGVIQGYSDPEDAVSECRRRFKNIPNRYMDAIEGLVENYFDGLKKRSI